MTIIINDAHPGCNHYLVKQHISIGDRVIFQQNDTEAEVFITLVQDSPGLMKGWRLISWQDPQIKALQDKLDAPRA